MKIKGKRFVKFIGLTAFGGLMMSPLVANAQDQGGRPPEFHRERPTMSGGEAQQDPRVRLQHLRDAARHLSASGFEDLANGVRQQIAQMETRLRNQNTPQRQSEFRQEGQAARNPGSNEKPAPGVDAAIVTEVRKLRQEMSELSNQLRRMQADAAPRRESKPRAERPDAKEQPDKRPNKPEERPSAPTPPPGDRLE